MFDLLQEYAAQHHQLSLPGIGLVALEKSAARADFSERMFYPPGSEWKLMEAVPNIDESLSNFISRKKNISVWEAKKELENFCNNIKHEISHSSEIKIPGIGILKNDINGRLQLETMVADTMLLKPVIAERVIRKDEAHTILVGDREKTSVEMNELLHSMESSRGQRWWGVAAAVFVFAMGLILYSYSNNNWKEKATGNQQTVTPQPLPVHVSSAFK